MYTHTHTNFRETKQYNINCYTLMNVFWALPGMKLGRHLLSACWDSVLDVLSVLLNGKSSCGINVSLGLMLGTEGAKEESIKARDAICLSLTGLQSAANLCCNLGMFCDNWVFSNVITGYLVM